MTAQPQETGHVVGWTIVLDPDGTAERIEVSTIEEWNRAFTKVEGVGGEFFTRIQGPNGVVESAGADPKQTPLGKRMILLPCERCGKKLWFYYRPEQRQTHCVCEDCNEERRYWQDLESKMCGE